MEKNTLSMEKKTLSMASGVTPQPSKQDEQLDPNLGSNLPVYPAMPRPRQLSAYDPEWEEDPQFSAQTRKTALLHATEKKLPSPTVLKDILSELTERQRSEEQEVALAASAAAGPKGPRVTRQLSTSTAMTFEGEMEAVRAVIDADVGRRTRANLTSAAMVSVAPEPDLARVNAGTGSQLQLDAVWVSTEAAGPAEGDEALYAAPLLATMGGYRPEAYSEASAKRRVMNLVQKDTSQPGTRRATGSGGRGERTVVLGFSTKDIYDPRARQHLPATEDGEFLEQPDMAFDPAEVSSPQMGVREQSLPDSAREEREATLRAASASPGMAVTFDVPRTSGRRTGKHARRRPVPEPEPEAPPAPRLSFAERFGGTQPGAAEAGQGGPAPSTLPRGTDDRHVSSAGAEGEPGSGGAQSGVSDVLGSGLGSYGNGPYRMTHGTEPYQMSRGPATRRVPRARAERFDVRGWQDDQRRAAEAPTLRHFYSDIRTIH